MAENGTATAGHESSDRNASKKVANERNHCKLLVVCAQGMASTQLRQALKALGFPQISAAPSHVAALDRAKSRPFTHIVFDAKSSDMPAIEFVEKMIELESSAIMIAISDQPKIDDVFGLLRAGARHFLVPPFNTETIEAVLVRASDGPALSEAVLKAPDRNAAFIAVVLNNLYRLAVSLRQAREFPSAARDVQFYTYAFRESMEMLSLFGEGGDDQLREAIMEACINRAKDAATRLGRLRKKLKRDRVSDEP
jgi:DNA-binding NarL/FixJ family response regulator